MLRDLWVPDAYFEDQSSHSLITALSGASDEKFIITKSPSTNSVTLKYFFSTKVSINCDMDFDRYPFDTQTCNFRIRSLKKVQNLRWKNLSVTSSALLKHSDFWIRMDILNKTKMYASNIVGFDLIIGRKYGSYIYEYFVPCLLMVVTSWVSFTVDPGAVPGRLGMLLTLFLMLINMSSSVSQTIPKERCTN